MAVTPEEFYDERRVAFVPMGFCFPGHDAKGGDLPPPGERAPLKFAKSGNDKVGAGRMEITGTQPPARVTVKLDFLRPFKSQNTTDYTLQPQGGDTEVTWTMSGPMPFISKLMSVFVSMDRMIGKDFESGLANLKAVAER